MERQTIAEQFTRNSGSRIINDLVEIHLSTIYQDDVISFHKAKKELFEKKYTQLSNFLGNKEFLLEYITYADFRLYFIVTWYDKIIKKLKLESLLPRYPNLLKHSKRIANLPGVKEYLASVAAKNRAFSTQSKVALE